MFITGFTKVARESHSEHEEKYQELMRRRRHGPSGLAAGAMGLGGSIAGSVAGLPLGAAATLTGGATGKENKLFKKITKEHKLKVGRHVLKGDALGEKINAYWRPKGELDRPIRGLFGKSIRMGKGRAHGLISYHKSHAPAIMAHELGHARHMGGMSPTHLKAHMYARGLGPLAGLLGAGALASSENEKVNKWAPAAAAAGYAPMLYQEGRASTHAVRDLYKHMGGKAALKGAGRLGLAFGTYAAPAIGSAWAIKHYQKKRKEALDKKD
jgi:hypothetical protein